MQIHLPTADIARSHFPHSPRPHDPKPQTTLTPPPSNRQRIKTVCVSLLRYTLDHTVTCAETPRISKEMKRNEAGCMLSFVNAGRCPGSEGWPSIRKGRERKERERKAFGPLHKCCDGGRFTVGVGVVSVCERTVSSICEARVP